MFKKFLFFMILLCFSIFNAKAVVYHENTEKVTHFDYSEYTVTYTDENGANHTVPITDVATTPEHMMALLRKIYTDPTIPGIHYAYDYNGTQYRKIDYNTYGHLGGNSNWLGTRNDFYPNPYEDGMTLILVQVRESWKVSYHNESNMKEYFRKAYSSMRLITDFTRVNDEQNPGYLFSLDGTTNRFFFLSKGKPRSTYTKPLFRLFEQISPVNANAGDAATESFIYEMLAGHTYYCFHDCTNVTSMTGGHWFTISNIGEIYNLSNLSIFIPDRRFEYQLVDENDNYINSSYFNEYGNSQNPGQEDWTVMPHVFIYNVSLTGNVKKCEDNDDYFKINLYWDSPLSSINTPEHFYVYILDESHNKVLLSSIDQQPTQNKSHQYLVERKYEPQTFYYVVTGAPINYDNNGEILLDNDGNPLITISAESKILKLTVPGKDPYFSNNLEYRSRYDINNEINIYKNKLQISPNTTNDYMALQNTDLVYELLRCDENNEEISVAQITFSYDENNNIYNYNIVYNDNSQNTDIVFDDEIPLTNGSFNDYNSANVNIIDRFYVSTANNDHSGSYIYKLIKHGEECSNECVVPVYKTSNELNNHIYTYDEIMSDTDRSLDYSTNIEINFDAINKPIYHITQYDIYMVNGNNIIQVGKAENLNNSGNYCIIGVDNNNYLNTVQSYKRITDIENLTLQYNNLNSQNVIKFVPVISSMHDNDINTYGCNMTSCSYPKLNISVNGLEKTIPLNYSNSTQMGYKANIQLTPLLSQDANTVYFYRLWRVIDDAVYAPSDALLNENTLEGAELYGANYEKLKMINPGEETIYITDIFKDNAIESGEEKTVTYIARLYAYDPTNESDRIYFISESQQTIVFNNSIITSINDIYNTKYNNSIMYYDMSGKYVGKDLNILIPGIYITNQNKKIVKF